MLKMSRGVRVRSGGGVRVDVNQELKLLKIWWGVVGGGVSGRGG